MDAVKTGEKDCEEETLQTAFKKLRVDAEWYLINEFFKVYFITFFKLCIQFQGFYLKKFII